METIVQAQSLKGTVTIPGDKSISHRAIMFGSIAKGTTRITNFLPGADCLSTISCFKQMGVQIEQDGASVVVEGKGIDGLREPSELLDVGNSGTTFRLMMGLLAGRPFHSVLAGDESIAKRPMNRVTVPLSQMGAAIDGRENGTFAPIAIRGGNLSGITYDSPVASAQVKSGILLAGLQADGVTTVTETHRSRNHTENMLESFGVKVKRDGLSVSVEGGQHLTATNVEVPGDISSAAFFLVAGAIVPNSTLTLLNVGINETRSGILDVLEQMGASLSIKNKRVVNQEEVADLTISTSDLSGTTIEGEMIPRLIDELPVIALLATQANGKTVIRNAEELKVKETNRIDAVVEALKTLGASVTGTPDGMVIEGPTRLHGGQVSSLGDHRIGMMLAVAGCITEGSVQLELPEAIKVSYPDFFEHLKQLRAGS
ncbi:3-phosphoshikimate 1-carboxyvinyltransferase [Alkalihalobacillus hwajinpoensis]|uniref:3-phosphoshikimate 1-carboxyvinyltransferase n=1 Tax=Guptibacillus hwajinpoensis TaxID=208199 RepID=UPI00188346D6|nr:3-phosphoshikimate 1-carboxyvinyltransferase [Pseudalkalibacillus hwajinpoensis]MBF0708994.1 3-phosphoshikimate 1-carboxyvinyltransferase [Pseudalkalibacillus hwajinpoensis]